MELLLELVASGNTQSKDLNHFNVGIDESELRWQIRLKRRCWFTFTSCVDLWWLP